MNAGEDRMEVAALTNAMPVKMRVKNPSTSNAIGASYNVLMTTPPIFSGISSITAIFNVFSS